MGGGAVIAPYVAPRRMSEESLGALFHRLIESFEKWVNENVRDDAVILSRLQPGDTVAVKLPFFPSMEQAHAIRQTWMAQLPEGVHVVVMSPGVEPAVLGRADVALPPDPLERLMDRARARRDRDGQ